MQFCFSSSVNDTTPKSEPQSPAKKFSSLRRKCLEAMAILCCGLNNVKANCLDISQFSDGCLDQGVVTSNDFITQYSTILQCVTEIYETLQTRTKSETEQFSAILKTIGSWVEAVANNRDLKDSPKGQTAIGHYLEMTVNLIIVSSKNGENHALNMNTFQNVSKIPEDLLASSAIWEFEKGTKKDPPAMSLLEQMLKPEFMHFVLIANADQGDKYFILMHKFLKAACLTRPQEGLNIIDIIFENFKSIDVAIQKKVAVPGWKVMAQVYIAYVDKYNDIHQTDPNWTDKFKPKLTASLAVLSFPILQSEFLSATSKPLWKLWTEAYGKFGEKAPLLVNYTTLEAEDILAQEIIKKLDKKDLNQNEWINLSTYFCQQFIQAIPFQSLTQESQGVQNLSGATEMNPLGKMYHIVQVLVKLLSNVSKFKDRKTAVVLAEQLVLILSHVTSQPLQQPLLKLICPVFTVILEKDQMFTNGPEFESKVKNAHDVIVNRLQSRYEGKFDKTLLEDLRPLLKVSLKHKNRDIKNKTHQMWQLTFASALAEKDIPNEIKDLLKDPSELSTSNSTISHTDSEPSNFAVPLAFSSIFGKAKKAQENEAKKANISKEITPKKASKKAISIDDESSQDFVKIASPSNKKRVLTEHQKEIMRKRKDDIPALYSELSRDDSNMEAVVPSMFQSQSLAGDESSSQPMEIPNVDKLDKTGNTDKDDKTGHSDPAVPETSDAEKEVPKETSEIQEASEVNGEKEKEESQEEETSTEAGTGKNKRKSTKPEKIDKKSPLKKKRGRPSKKGAQATKANEETVESSQSTSEPPKKTIKAPKKTTEVQESPKKKVDIKDINEKPSEEPPIKKNLKRKATSPLKDMVSEVNQQILNKPEVHINRLSPTNLELSQVSPVKIITENPLVIQPAKVPFQLNNHDEDIIASSQPLETDDAKSDKNKAKKGKRHSIAVVQQNNSEVPEKRSSRRASQKLNMSLSEAAEVTKPIGKENEGPQPKANKVKTNKYGESPLHVAVKKGDYEKAKTLIEDGAEVNLKDHAGWTPLHEAAAHYNTHVTDIMKLLVDNGADVNAKANNGATPLHDAVMFLPEECIKFLLTHGADGDIENDEGKTPRNLVPELKRNLFETISPATSPTKTFEADEEGDKVLSQIIEEEILENDNDVDMEDIEADDNLNDSTNSVLATPLEESIDEGGDEEMKSVPSSQNDENNEVSESQEIIESSQTKEGEQKEDKAEESSSSLIKPPLPVIKNPKSQVLASVFNSRGARLLMMSKDKKTASPSSTASGSSQDSPNQRLMSPRPDKPLILTPTQTKREAWQKFVPSPCDASPSASILKRQASTDDVNNTKDNDQEAPPLKRRRVQFMDPPVSDQVVIPRCPSGKATRQKLQESRFNRDMFLSAVAKDLSKDKDQDSCGLYEATPPLEGDTPTNCIYSSLSECDEPVCSILHNLTTKTWHKAAEKSLQENGITTIGDLSKLTALKASSLKSLKPPNNLAVIKEALRKFEKSWIKRGKDKYQSSPVKSDEAPVEAPVEAPENDNDTENVEAKKDHSPTVAPVVEHSTPEEEEETMKEIYERPSPSPTESIEMKENREAMEVSEELSDEETIKKAEVIITEEHAPVEKIIVETCDAGTETVEKESNDASVATDKKDLVDAAVETEVKKTKHAQANTDVKSVQDCQQQTEAIEAKEVMEDFFKVMANLSVHNLSEVISRAAKAIQTKNAV